MLLHETLNDPLDPARSLQLNNRYWPGDKYELLSPLREAEAALREDGVRAAARHLRYLKKYFRDDQTFAKMLRRLHRLWSYRSSFGCLVGKLELPNSMLQANRYSGQQSRSSYPLRETAPLQTLVAQTCSIYRREYGADIVRANRTVRYARPDERQRDVTDHGPLSDFHNDEYKGITTVVYLDNVQAGNGAFSYVRDSNLVPRSVVLSAIHQCVDFDLKLLQPNDMIGLPLEFRGSTGIGNFLDRDKLEVVSDCVVVLEGGAGTYVTFNGQYLLHRGGKPLTGSRLAAFIQPEGIARHKLISVGSLVFGLVNRGR